jgi:uncharacterized protein
MQSQPSLLLRIVQFPPVRLLLMGATILFLLGLTNGLRGKFAASPGVALAVAVGMSTLGLAVHAGLVRWLERRPVTELALPGIGRELGAGLLLGALLYSLAIGVLMALGCYRIHGLNPAHAMLPTLGMALASGVLEEVLFRGVLFRIVEQWQGSWVAMAVSSLVFGVSHLANPQGTLLGALFISVEAGVLLAAAFMVTRRLWLAIGIHIAWNFTQSAIFSGAVSGNAASPGLLKATMEGPLLLTGGDFGVEGSVVAFAVCTAAGLLLLRQAARRGHVQPRPGRAQRAS